ncbi:MAG: transcriptional regulator [Rhodoferax sp.]
MNVAIGTTIWIYVKLPVGSVMGRARVSAVHSLTPATLWRRFAAISGLTHKEFFDYFEGVSKGFGLSLEGAERLPHPISLHTLRQVSSGFQPPQFFMRLGLGGDLLNTLAESQSVCAAPDGGVDDVREFSGNNKVTGDGKKIVKTKVAVCQ